MRIGLALEPARLASGLDRLRDLLAGKPGVQVAELELESWRARAWITAPLLAERGVR